MKKQTRKLVIAGETVARLGSRVLGEDALHQAAGGSVKLSCAGIRCSGVSLCNPEQNTVPLCDV